MTKRENNQLRPFTLEFGVLETANGSVKFSQGDSQVIVAVFGPSETKPKFELSEKSTFQVIFKPRIGGIRQEKYVEYENLLTKSLETCICDTQYPRASISVIVQVTCDSGSILSTAYNGAVFALLDSGISLNFIPIATSVCLNEKKQIQLDPSLDQEAKCTSSSFFVFNKSTQGLISVQSNGVMSDEEFLVLFKAAKSTIPSIFDFIQKSISQVNK